MEEPERQESTHQPEPELLYHYTDQQGLDGILSSGVIWATHYRFFNDSTERQLGLDAYNVALLRIACDHFGSKESAKTLAGYLRKYYSDDSLPAYIVSFCASYAKEEYENARERGVPLTEDRRGGDRLSQWRGYGRGSQGYCLAFDFQMLRQLPENLNPFYHGFCTYYAEDSEGRTVEAHVRELLSQLEGLSADDLKNQAALDNALLQDEKRRSKIVGFVVDMLMLCGVLKHSGFREENEYRLIKLMLPSKMNPEELNFRSTCIPYIKIDLNLTGRDSPLRAVFVGPSANKDQAVYGLELRLKKMGLSADILPSKIPYRNW